MGPKEKRQACHPCKLVPVLSQTRIAVWKWQTPGYVRLQRESSFVWLDMMEPHLCPIWNHYFGTMAQCCFHNTGLGRIWWFFLYIELPFITNYISIPVVFNISGLYCTNSSTIASSTAWPTLLLQTYGYRQTWKEPYWGKKQTIQSLTYADRNAVSQLCLSHVHCSTIAPVHHHKLPS